MGSSLSDSRKKNLCFAACAAGIFLLQLYKARLGLGSNDEQFYTTLGYRLVQGDALFFDDWHIAQMISFFLYLPVKAFIAVHGSTEGILLYMRILYSVFTEIVGIALYSHFHKHGVRAAAAACAYTLFTPFSIQALSYNTMSVGFLILSLLFLDHHTKAGDFFSGLFLACAVLNTPYLLILYLGALILTIAKPEKLSHGTFLRITCGAAFIAILFCTLVFSRATFSEVLQGLPHLIDPSHQDSILMHIAKSGYRLLRIYHVFLILYAGILIWILKIHKKHGNSEKAMFLARIICAAAVIYQAFISPFNPEMGGYNVVLIPFAGYGLLKAINEPHDSFERLCFTVSMIHSFLISISSNVGPSSFSGPMILACVITILWVNHEKGEQVSAALFLAALLFVKVISIYDGSGDYSVKAEDGPLAGLYDSAENIREYEQTLSDMEIINSEEEQSVILVSQRTWAYLALQKPIAAISTYQYLLEPEQFMEIQEEYLSLHPDDFPVLIYADTEDSLYGLVNLKEWFSKGEKVCRLQNGILYRRNR